MGGRAGGNGGPAARGELIRWVGAKASPDVTADVTADVAAAADVTAVGAETLACGGDVCQGGGDPGGAAGIGPLPWPRGAGG
jgi:hypothetical protein